MPDYIFVYDHNLLKGQEDNEMDPTDAILYFYPPTTNIDQQHSLCSYVAGTCQILANILQSPPTYFVMEPAATISCVHHPSNGLLIHEHTPRTITFGLYTDLNPSNNAENVLQRVTLLYESFIFYQNQCLSCVFSNGKRSFSKTIMNILERLTFTLQNKSRLCGLFNLSPYSNPSKNISPSINKDILLRITNLINRVIIEVTNENSIEVIGGCLFYKLELILSQLPTQVTNLFSLIIDCLSQTNKDLQDYSQNQLFSSIKNNIVNIEQLKPRNGVYLFKVCLTHKTYNQLIERNCNRKFVDQNTVANSNEFCCLDSHCRYVLLYLEYHSETAVIFLINESDVSKITEKILKHFSKLCFNEMGEIEAEIWTGSFDILNTVKPESDDNTKKRGSSSLSGKSTTSTNSNNVTTSGNISEWNLVYNQNEQNLQILSSNNSNSNNSSINQDWEENLMKKASFLHEIMQKETDICEINGRFPKESLNATKSKDTIVYTVKKYN